MTQFHTCLENKVEYEKICMLITFLTHQNPFEMIFLYKMEKFCLFISIECAIRSTTYQKSLAP